MSNRMQKLPKSIWWSGASLVVMVVGAFGPWAKVGELVTINGTDGGRDGWVIVSAAGVAALSLVLYLRFTRGWLLVLPLLAGLAAVATTVYDISDIDGGLSDSLLFSDVPVAAQWGIYVALVGSVSLTLATIGLLIEAGRTTPAPVEATTEA